MRKISQLLLILCFTLAASFAQAEPANLAIVKKQLIQYHDSGNYERELTAVINKAMQYLKMRIAKGDFQGKKPAIVLDIDETSLSNYPDMFANDFGGSMEAIRQAEDKGQDPAIIATLKLYQFAKANNVAVFFITGRFEMERDITAANLKAAGYNNWDGLIFRTQPYEKVPAAQYKTVFRKQLEEQGYDIILSIGDQKSDLDGGYADKTFKLPNPYYFIP